MTEEIKGRIEQIKAGQVPEGYIKQYKYIFPVSWKLYHLGELTQNNSRKNMTADELPTYSINNQVGFIPQNEQFDEGSYSDLDKTCYKIVKRGEFAYNPARINVGSLGLLKDKDAVIVSSLYVCFSLKREFSNLYFENWFTTTAFHKEILRNLEGSVREYLFYENFSNIRLPVPPLPEQKKIAEILRQCDKVIELKQSKIEELQKLKKTCLSKMFPKEGHNVPELRFPGFTDAWEQRKLGDVGSTFTGLAGKCKEDFGHGKAKFITYMNVYLNPIADVEMVESVEIDAKQNRVQNGDVFFTTSSETPEEVGMSSVWLGNTENTYLNSFCFGYRPSEKIDLFYLAYMLRSDAIRQRLILLAQGISRYNISKNKVMEIGIPLPALEEQHLLGAFFNNLDNLITLHQRELEETRKYKKALMQLLLMGIVRVPI